MKRNIYVQLSGIVLAMLMLTQCSTSKNTTKGDNNDKKNAPISATSVVANALQGNWQFDYFTMVNTDKTILFPMQVPSLNFDPKEKKFSGNASQENTRTKRTSATFFRTNLASRFPKAGQSRSRSCPHLWAALPTSR